MQLSNPPDFLSAIRKACNAQCQTGRTANEVLNTNLPEVHRRSDVQHVTHAEREYPEEVDLFHSPLAEKTEDRKAMRDFGAK
jgi:hypothetical protein